MQRRRVFAALIIGLMMWGCSESGEGEMTPNKTCRLNEISWRFDEVTTLQYDDNGDLTSYFMSDQNGVKKPVYEGRIAYENDRMSEIRFYDSNGVLIENYWIEFNYLGSVLTRKIEHNINGQGIDEFKETRYSFRNGKPVELQYVNYQEGIYGFDSLTWENDNVVKWRCFQDGTIGAVASYNMQYDDKKNVLQEIGGYVFDDYKLMSRNNVLNTTGVEENANINDSYSYQYNESNYPVNLNVTYKYTYLGTTETDTDNWIMTYNCN